MMIKIQKKLTLTERPANYERLAGGPPSPPNPPQRRRREMTSARRVSEEILN